MPSPLPHWIKSIKQGAWGARATYKNLEFHNFKAKTGQGLPQIAVSVPPDASDYIPPQHFDGVTFNNVENDAMTLLFDPPQAWANIKDCGNFPCTAPKNVVMNMKNIKFTGEAKPDIAKTG